MPYRLSGLSLDRVDLVPDGSNPDAHIVLFKSKEGNVPAPKKAAAKKPPVKKTGKADTRSKSKQRGNDDEEEEDEDDAILNKADDDEDDDEEVDEDEIEKADDEDEGDLDDEDDEEEEDEEDDKPRKKSKPTKKSKPVKKLKARVAKTEDEDDEDDTEDDTEELDAEVLKSLPVSVRKRLLRSERIAKEALETATIEKERRETLEFIEKAKRDIPNLSGTAEEKGELYRALYSGRPIEKKTADKIVKLLKTGDVAVREHLMSEVGSRSSRSEGEDTAISQLREKQEEIRKANPKLTKEQAFEEACKQNKDLFKQYRVEKSRRVPVEH